MYNFNYYNNDPDDLTLHYRVYKPPFEDKLYVVCVQNFDYPDYDEDGFVDSQFYLNEAEAERKILQLESPDEYIPGIYDTHYRLYKDDNDKEIVVTINSEYEYENYVSERFIDDFYYEYYSDAANSL
jgi:hypothetical protein